MTYFLNVKAQTYDEPWFNIEIPYAYFKAELTSTRYRDIYALPLQVSINYNTYKPQINGRIEYIELVVYTEEHQLLNSTYFISASNSDKNPSDVIAFAREDWFNSTDFDLSRGGGGVFIDSTTQIPLAGGTCGTSTSTSDDDSDWLNERYGDLRSALEKTQTIYFDVKRVGYVTFDGNNTVVTFAGKQVIQHIELTKNGNAYAFGNIETIEKELAKKPYWW
ncbi:MAG: hypothetical protein LBH62_04640 [Nitrososphaerota archaeon]|nr:hypothetical protein [Nitrososphaerota archaeon]